MVFQRPGNYGPCREEEDLSVRSQWDANAVGASPLAAGLSALGEDGCCRASADIAVGIPNEGDPKGTGIPNERESQMNMIPNEHDPKGTGTLVWRSRVGGRGEDPHPPARMASLYKSSSKHSEQSLFLLVVFTEEPGRSLCLVTLCSLR